MENYINNITFQIKLQIKLQSKEIILLACRKFTNAWKFTPIIVGLKIIHYNRCNFIQNFFTVWLLEYQNFLLVFCLCLNVLRNFFDCVTKLFSALYLVKFLFRYFKFFPCNLKSLYL